MQQSFAHHDYWHQTVANRTWFLFPYKISGLEAALCWNSLHPFFFFLLNNNIWDGETDPTFIAKAEEYEVWFSRSDKIAYWMGWLHHPKGFSYSNPPQIIFYLTNNQKYIRVINLATLHIEKSTKNMLL